jgi:asparagine synthase (glutamine-hydrolysing)
MIALDMQYALHDLDLPTLVRACALAGVEAGVPYLHDGVVAFAARLDPVLKTNGDARRGLFRTALRAAPSLPLATPGAGLAVPFGQWLQTDARLRALAFDSLADLRRRRIVRADFIDSLLTRHVPAEPARHGTMVWLLMMMEQWFAQRRVDSVQHNAVPARVPAHIT